MTITRCLDHLDPAYIERGSHSSLEIGERETKGESVRGSGNQDRRQMEGCLLTPPPPLHFDKKVRATPPPLLPPPPPPHGPIPLECTETSTVDLCDGLYFGGR